MIDLDEAERLLAKMPDESWVPKFIKAVYLDTGRAEHEIRSRVDGRTIARIIFDPDEAEAAYDPIQFFAFARNNMKDLIAELRELRKWKTKSLMVLDEVERFEVDSLVSKQIKLLRDE